MSNNQLLSDKSAEVRPTEPAAITSPAVAPDSSTNQEEALSSPRVITRSGRVVKPLSRLNLEVFFLILYLLVFFCFVFCFF